MDLDTNKIKEQINTIICNQNKDSYVDKNIILDQNIKVQFRKLG